MSKDSEPPQPKAAKPIQRLGTGALSMLQIACFTVLLLAANYLGSQHHKPKDLSEDLSYTLSSATRRYLSSPALAERETPVKLLVAFRRSNPLYEKVRVLAYEYGRLSNGKIEVELLDPIRSPDRTQQVVDEYGKVFGLAFGKSIFTSDLVIVDARDKAQREAAEQPDAPRSASPHIRFIEAETMARFETDLKEQRKMTGFLGEDALTTGIVASIEGKPRKVYLLADKCGFTGDNNDAPLPNFEGALLTQNALTTRARIAELDRIPDDAAAVAIINPTYDFTTAELEVLTEYWNRPRSSLLITLGTNTTPPRLRAFLRNHGITPGKDRVVTRKAGRIVSTVRGTFTEGMEFTRDLWNKTAAFDGATCSLDIRDKDNEDLIDRRILPYTLLATDSEFWGETAFSSGDPQFDIREDNPGPIRLAGAVIRGAATRDDIGGEISRMLVIANSDFLAPSHFSDINRDFLASGMNWLMGREELAGSGPRSLGVYKLPLLDSQVSFINRINLFFLPAFALLIAAIIWSSRRA
ncbi:MAG: hypothetical protein EAZ65_00790 [Verrucomicrobia bacterium]|nr:MAG: hypothetical protein EAZ84_13120 [Verrucomicrobiota bacterium]TAE89252.1 MAG: hypothetical protein EAZ82_01105 [Verrucomicrobiota bacterium]TAF27874.1 MAG: hypothetical protein EAZ71_00795 [Verrucomicrobiota bacterium]TAF42723.1 MAG: hypothetical protein EAZ65_00790 [Verrucomicrobiota bacterium]